MLSIEQFNTRDEAYIHLRNMGKQAGDNLYDRLRIADYCLSDRSWVDDPTRGGGDESKAIDRIEQECFGELCGAMSLPQMLEVLHAVPQVEVWRRNKYNLRRMYEELKMRRGSARAGAGTGAASSRASPTAGSKGTEHSQEQEHAEVLRLRELVRSQVEQIRKQAKEIKRLRRAVKGLQQAIAAMEEPAAV